MLRVNGGGELTLADTIRQARRDAHLSQVELAAILNVAPRTVQNWEAGRMPQPRHMRALAMFLASPEEQTA